MNGKKILTAITLVLFLFCTFTGMALASPAIPTQVSTQNKAPQPARLLNTPQKFSTSLRVSPTLYPEACQPNFSSTLRYLDTAGNWHCFGGFGSTEIGYDNVTHIHAGIYDAAFLVYDTTTYSFNAYRLYPGQDFAVSHSQAVRIYIGSRRNAYPEACQPNSSSTFKINATDGTFCFGSHGGGLIGTGNHNTSTISSGLYNALLFNSSNTVYTDVSSGLTESFPYQSGDLFTA